MMNMYFATKAYRLRHWMFTWNAEPEEEGGSIVFTFCKCIHFLKYKDSTIVYFGRKPEFSPARKYVEAYQY